MVARASGAYACTHAIGVARVIVSVTSSWSFNWLFSNRIPLGIGVMVSNRTVTPLAVAVGMFPSNGIVAVISFPNLICIWFLLYYASIFIADIGQTQV